VPISARNGLRYRRRYAVKVGQYSITVGRDRRELWLITTLRHVKHGPTAMAVAALPVVRAEFGFPGTSAYPDDLVQREVGGGIAKGGG
jgi:hypothetical protein